LGNQLTSSDSIPSSRYP